MAREELVAASEIINRVCRHLKYSRSHVARVLRDNAELLGAECIAGRWLMPPSRALKLRELVVRTSGKRYKLREKGPHAKAA